MRRDPFQAIADPTRRQIIGMLVDEPLSLNAIANKFDVSRPAISKHVKVLEESGVIEIQQSGRERFCHIQFSTLKHVADWINTYEEFWTQKLNNLEDHLKTKHCTKEP